MGVPALLLTSHVFAATQVAQSNLGRLSWLLLSQCAASPIFSPLEPLAALSPSFHLLDRSRRHCCVFCCQIVFQACRHPHICCVVSLVATPDMRYSASPHLTHANTFVFRNHSLLNFFLARRTVLAQLIALTSTGIQHTMTAIGSLPRTAGAKTAPLMSVRI
jgi:hypothetical protein